MPSLSAPQLALLRSQQQTSQWYCVPIPPVTIFSAQVNSSSITVGAVVIPYDGATGSFADVKKGMTVLVGSAPGLSDYGILRERLDADATNLYVAWNSDIAWADNLYLTVYEQFLAWSVRQRIVPPTIYKDYNVAYTDQTDAWPPIALMGDNVCKFFTGNPTNVTFPISGIAVAAGATITSYAINFGDGSTSTSSGNVTHGYTAAGTYYATLTVTDSNGKTHLTRRIVCLPDPTTVYTVKFEGTSLEGAVDNGWTAKVRVFDPNADIAHFPERAPCFLISSDTYGGTSGGVGFPSGREEVVFFGYIVEDSVAVQPEYNEITFDLESIAGVMGRADSPPVYLGDSSNPAGEPDAWAWGKNLNVFRGLVFLLKFHSTVMDIADVSLYNDTTLTKAVDYPQDNLWNMLLQFAKGKRLMRASVTRTGTVVVGRDPNLVPVASRGAFTTVCTLVQGDWKEQVTIPQKPYPITSFICISGLVYDGNPAHEPNPVFGMSPGRPPKDYGAEREIQYLKLVDQVECNTLAGLLLGTDNMPFGDIVIPMRGNWVKCFEPALQEYVQTPSGGWVTKRGVLLDSIKVIVRKVSVSFDWENGTMMPTLTCDYYSQPDIGVNGDCFPPDAPPPPQSSIPPIVPTPLPNPTNGANVDVWTLFAAQDVYRLLSVAPSGGSATSRPAWKAGLGASQVGIRLAPSPNSMVNIIAEVSGDAHLPHSTDNGATWRDNDTGIVGGTGSFNLQYMLATDPANRNRVFAVNQPLDPSSMPTSAKDNLALQFQAIVPGGYTDWAVALAGLADWYADFAPVYMWVSTNGGGSYTPVLLDYLGQLVPTRFMFNGQTFGAGSTIKHMQAGNVDSGHTLGQWQAFMCPSMTAAYAVANGYGNPGDFNYDGATPPWLAELVEVSTSGGSHEVSWDGFFVCNTLPLSDSSNYLFYAPFGVPYALAPLYNGSAAYVILWVQGYANTAQDLSDPTAIERAVIPVQSWYSGLNPAAFSTDPYVVYFYKVTTAGVRSRQTTSVGVTGPYFGAADPTDTDHLFFIPQGSPVPVYRYTWSTNTLTTVNASLSVGGGFTQQLLVTTQGTILVACNDGTFRRSTNGGTTFASIDPGFGASGLAMDEWGGVVGGRPGVLVATNDNTGKYIYSLDDGVTWRTTSDLTVHANSRTSRAR